VLHLRVFSLIIRSHGAPFDRRRPALQSTEVLSRDASRGESELSEIDAPVEVLHDRRRSRWNLLKGKVCALANGPTAAPL
jgi:hypothetical protein